MFLISIMAINCVVEIDTYHKLISLRCLPFVYARPLDSSYSSPCKPATLKRKRMKVMK